MESSLSNSSSPIVFSHNDAMPANMVRTHTEWFIDPIYYSGGHISPTYEKFKSQSFFPLSKLHFNYTKLQNIKPFPTIGHTGGDEYRHCQVD